VRSLALYGDVFYRVSYSTDGVLYGHIIQKPQTITRIESAYGTLEGFKQRGVHTFRESHTHEISYGWDFIHFRNRVRSKFFPYGTSIEHNAIRPYRQLIMSEDSALIYRICRHPDRLLHKIDVGRNDWAVAKKLVRDYMQRYRNNILRPNPTGFDHRFNLLTPTDDLYLGVTEISKSDITKLPGSSNAFEVYDINHYLNKFCSAVRVPKAYLGFEADVNAKATLTNQSARFARAVRHLQDSVKLGIRQLIELHLRLLTKDDNDTTYDWESEGQNFNVEMGVVSYIAELDWLDVLSLRVSIAESLAMLGESPYVNPDKMTAYVFTHILKFNDAEVRELVRKTPRKEALAAMGVDVDGAKDAAAKSSDEDIDGLADALQSSVTLTDDEKTALQTILENPEVKSIIAKQLALRHTEFDGSPMPLPPKKKAENVVS